MMRYSPKNNWKYVISKDTWKMKLANWISILQDSWELKKIVKNKTYIKVLVFNKEEAAFVGLSGLMGLLKCTVCPGKLNQNL